ncbi:leucyl/phenylalanyl-tRNA--protein transferase [Arachnia propionica]|uniref:leucyl/phenylalanyl-tRNA--protein transferase n=1 Tax=Arachnia propionica TaxID=1750 RepID=UPI0021AB5D85|nr:leucyl/phenylalanyl-tRNA--protein transferase [Arachnia propionica]MDO5083958.1 leucyl/phenylalanyl-tRNA--protein transferase [Arachnia propionica]
MLDSVFGSPRSWPRADLIGYTDEFDPRLALAAYCSGVFPMPLDQRMGWWSPMSRAVLPLDALRVTRSLRRSAARHTTTVDRAFDRVLGSCADPRRPGGWIDERITAVYTTLHHMGFAHSVETWDDQGRLVGGLYGILIAGLFAGESMFHHPELGRDASKVALMRLVADLRHAGVTLLDVQWQTPHLASLGVVEWPREIYLQRLVGALNRDHGTLWQGEPPRLSGRDLVRRLSPDPPAG